MDGLDSLIANYSPSEQAKELVKRTKIALLAGISGAGKNSIKAKLLERDDYKDIVSYTTRSPRINDGVSEVPDVTYHFIDQSTAIKMINDRQFIEVKLVHGTSIYGTAMAELDIVNSLGKIAINDIDVQGADEYHAISDKVKIIFILPPSFEVWQQRIKKRYETNQEFETEWSKRRISAIKELTKSLEAPYYQFVINDDLDEVSSLIDKIIRSEGEYYHDDSEARQIATDILNKTSFSTR